ncbi:hypothetical protein DYB32_000660 [Aphanomyces invadans]|uniref:Uncharacterized protein n=1 Tax=Aphanomyces invadans TaxID=157072 RepID=A0A3R6Z5K5_9STRA|nr:hypothetical protein DYB32_000660 [Aphanomyces invadans]
MVPPDLPPLEVLSDEELHHITSSTSSGHTKSTSEVAMKSNPPAAAAASTNPKKHPPPDNPLFVHAVIVVLMLYLAACAYAYLCPLEGIPWEVEFALPTQNISSNCTVTILHPLEGQVTSRNVIEFELHAPSNTTNSSQIMQYTIQVDDAVHVMELTVLLDGVKVQTLPPSTDAAATKQVHRGVLVGLHPGHHTLHIRGLHDDNDIDNVWFHILETN